MKNEATFIFVGTQDSIAYIHMKSDARAMAKDVHNVMRNLVMKKLGKNEQDAEKYLKDMQDSGRYQTGLILIQPSFTEKMCGSNLNKSISNTMILLR